uniref:Uncharacterized protein n=1 Tax=Glossina pallidipes TaxID=7398 RepID=A0A1A9Z9T3_GLOPL
MLCWHSVRNEQSTTNVRLSSIDETIQHQMVLVAEYSFRENLAASCIASNKYIYKCCSFLFSNSFLNLISTYSLDELGSSKTSLKAPLHTLAAHNKPDNGLNELF